MPAISLASLYLQDNALDYTLSFRQLATRLDASDGLEFGEFESKWKRRLASQPDNGESLRLRMHAVNPLFIPRNHQVERAIQGAIEGDLSIFRALGEVLKNPFQEQPEFSAYAQPPSPAQRVTQTFCGT